MTADRTPTSEGPRTAPIPMTCGECGHFLPNPRAYHPFAACLIFKATGRDPLRYLQEVGRYYRDHPEELSR